MKKILWVFIGLLLCLYGVSYAGPDLSYYGYVKNETSLRLNDLNSDLTKEKEIVMLAGQYQANPDLAFFGRVKYFYDFAYAARDKMKTADHYMKHIQRSEWLRDCYMDYTKGPWCFSLGKQQVAWGQSDGIAVLDRVNPVDLREFWLPDSEDIRIPEWTLNINYSPRLNSNLQLLIIPDFEESQAAPPGAPFVFRSYSIFDAFRKQQEALLRTFRITQYPPGERLNQATWGLQWSDIGPVISGL